MQSEEYPDNRLHNLFPSEDDFDAEAGIYEIANMRLAVTDMNQQLMFSIIRTLEKSFTWRFRSLEKKLSAIDTMFTKLSGLIKEKQEDANL